jgi:hypothetical protein
VQLNAFPRPLPQRQEQIDDAAGVAFAERLKLDGAELLCQGEAVAGRDEQPLGL